MLLGGNEVPLHVENPLSDKVDVILPSNEVIDSPASNEIDENVLLNIVAAKQSLNEFYENILSIIVFRMTLSKSLKIFRI